MTSNIVFMRVGVPDWILAEYEKQAKELGIEVEELLAQRLAKCQGHTANSPLYFNDKDKAELGTLLGKQGAFTARQVLDMVRDLVTFKVEGIRVKLPKPMLKRMQTRKFGKSLEEAIRRDTLKGLEMVWGA